MRSYVRGVFILSNFTEKVLEILQPYRYNMLNESASEAAIKEFSLCSIVNGPTYHKKSFLFFTTLPHLFLAVESNGEFKYQVTSYQKFEPTPLVADICRFAKTLDFDETNQLDFVIYECKSLFNQIINEFVQDEIKHDVISSGDMSLTVRKTNTPFLLLEDEWDIETIFNSI